MPVTRNTACSASFAAGKPPAEALQDLVDNTMVVVGDVEDSRKHVQRVADAGVTDLLCQFQVGGLAHDRVVSAMHLFADEVCDPEVGFAAAAGDAWTQFLTHAALADVQATGWVHLSSPGVMIGSDVARSIGSPSCRGRRLPPPVSMRPTGCSSRSPMTA